MPRQLSEERIREEHAHKEMNVPPFVGGIDPSIAKHSGWRLQLEQAGWYLRNLSKEV